MAHQDYIAGILAAFTTIQTDAGTSPVASGADTLTLTSSDGSLTITGDASADEVDFSVSGTSVGFGFTQGSVPFAAASGALAEDNAGLFWDDTNNILGIGTATPNGGTNNPLHVVSGAENADTNWFTNNIAVFEKDNNGYINIRTPNDKSSGILFSDPDHVFRGGLAYNHTDNSMTTYTNGTVDRLKITSAGLVGLGIATPLGCLHINQNGTAAAIPTLYLNQADLSEEMIEFTTTIGAGNPIEAVAATTFTPTHYIRLTIPGPLSVYLQAGTFA